jgi:transmembrane sensor
MAEPRWEILGRKIDPRWEPAREEGVRAAIRRRAAERRVATRAGMSLVGLALVAGGIGAFVGVRRHAPIGAVSVQSVATATAERAATVSITNLTPDTVLEPMPDRGGGGRAFALRAGGARFVVSHDVRHPLVVVAGDIVIEDLGTTFTVQYPSPDRVDVAVEEGRVEVHAQSAVTQIGAGESQEFTVSPPPSANEPPGRAVAASAPAPLSSSWRVLAENGRYEEAHAALKKAGPNAVRDETADLLLAADALRLSGNPAAAVPYLERVVAAHAADPRSSLASFTLGRVLLDELGRPGEAADAFARARSAGGPLAEDALAREVEATSRAGDAARSRELAREYQTVYPNGRRAKTVSKFGGLD